MGHLLGPHVVGRRIVVRRVLPGERGPTGGPAMTDVLGVCTAWDGRIAALRREDGTQVVIRIADIVSGKPVPPRPSVRHRVAPRDAQLRALSLWPGIRTEPLGSWVLRWSDAHGARRANSVLAMGPPEPGGVDLVTRHYRDLDRRPIAAVLPDSAEEGLFRAAGWVPESADADSLFLLGGVAAARRRLVERPAYGVDLEVEEGSVVARIGGEASGVAALDGDWLGLRSLTVRSDRRRRGLGLALVASLLDWGAEQGATTTHLQVISDNLPALGLYERLGFTAHHAYRYLAAC